MPDTFIGTNKCATSWVELTYFVDCTCTSVVSPLSDHVALAPLVKPEPLIVTSSAVSCGACAGLVDVTATEVDPLPPPPPPPFASLAPPGDLKMAVGSPPRHDRVTRITAATQYREACKRMVGGDVRVGRAMVLMLLSREAGRK